MIHERDWYTQHVMDFVRAELNGHIVEKRLGTRQTWLDNYAKSRRPVSVEHTNRNNSGRQEL